MLLKGECDFFFVALKVIYLLFFTLNLHSSLQVNALKVMKYLEVLL